MNFDLRLPIGLLFSFYGLLLAGYGVFTRDSKEMYERSLGINVNLGWGLVLLAFGAVMLALAFRGKRPQPAKQPATETKVPAAK